MSDMTLAEAAKSVGKSAVTLRALVNAGKLKSYQKGRVHHVNLNDVIAIFGNRSSSDMRAGASTKRGEESDGQQAMMNALQSQIRALENERDFLRNLVDLEKREKAEMMRELLHRTAELKAFLENKPGLFNFLKR